MASHLLSRVPECRSCIRRSVGSFESAIKAPAFQQIRGKKKLAKVTTIKAHLLRNIPGYGRKGAVVPVTAGMMRNIWIPQKWAEYATLARLEELGVKKDAVLERDGGFQAKGSKVQRRIEKEAAQKAQEPQEVEKGGSRMPPEQVLVNAEVDQSRTTIAPEVLSPEKATSVLEKKLPKTLELYRTTVASKQPPKRISPSIPQNATLSAAAEAAAAAKSSPEDTAIIGSVSTHDIAVWIKAMLSDDRETSSVRIDTSDVTFVAPKGESLETLKNLGTYEIQVHLKDAPQAVKRRLEIKPTEYAA